MSTQKALKAIELIMDAADITPERLVDFLLDAPPEPKPDREPMEILSDALNQAKSMTRMEDEEIGQVIGVTGGAVGHWRRGRTNATSANQLEIYRWVRSVEQALGISIFPEGFSLEPKGQGASVH